MKDAARARDKQFKLTIETTAKLELPDLPEQTLVASASLPPLSEVPTHTLGFESFRWEGRLYFVSQIDQRLILAHLWEGTENGCPFIDASTLLEAIDRPGAKLKDVFSGTDLLGTVILDGRRRGGPTGSFCLAWATPA